MKRMKVEEALIKGLEEALEFEEGRRKLKTNFRELPSAAPKFSATQVRKIRKELFYMTQEEFAVVLNVSVATLRSWEQGVRKPSDSSLRLLEILKSRPDILQVLAG
ncbi:MAG: XRE family transcriptional regulator [Bdellovibrionales bacterium CG10_big_fil_rev_8_21_14_0_10_45_34]|nr:MAG: XRE family transcriptional regulator [Bdellovibrionales bacterium CG10_big_fil_rev_8_21_14_0_10_45_34]